MSITLGLYDLFSYLIPGILFLYTLNEFLILLNWDHIDISQLSSISQLTIVGVLAYIAGHLFASISYYVWFRRIYSGYPDRAIEKVKERCSGIRIDYEPQEWAILLEVLRQRNIGALEDIERYKANSLMMRNISLALFLFSIFQVTTLMVSGFSYIALAVGILSIVLAYFAKRWGNRHDEWYYRSIFAQALSYGPNLQVFLSNDKPQWEKRPLRTERDTSEEF